MISLTRTHVSYRVKSKHWPKYVTTCIFNDYNIRNNTWDLGEDIVIVEPGEGINVSWQITFDKPSTGETIDPTEGDIFYIATNRPFNEKDVYRYRTIASKIDDEKVKSSLEEIRVVPNPYVVTNRLEPLDRQNPRDRGPRRVYFDKLPTSCKITIYTITGELVKEISHESSIDNGQEFWDLTTKDNFLCVDTVVLAVGFVASEN